MSCFARKVNLLLPATVYNSAGVGVVELVEAAWKGGEGNGDGEQHVVCMGHNTCCSPEHPLVGVLATLFASAVSRYRWGWQGGIVLLSCTWYGGVVQWGP